MYTYFIDKNCKAMVWFSLTENRALVLKGFIQKFPAQQSSWHSIYLPREDKGLNCTMWLETLALGSIPEIQPGKPALWHSHCYYINAIIFFSKERLKLAIFTWDKAV